MHLNRHALKDFREARGLTVTELARRSGTTQSHVSNIEAGRRVPSLDLIRALAEALNVNLLSIASSEIAA